MNDSFPAPGMFDFVGKARRAEWLALGEMSKEKAKELFVSMLDKSCPQFEPYLEAQFIVKLKESEERSTNG